MKQPASTIARRALAAVAGALLLAAPVWGEDRRVSGFELTMPNGATADTFTGFAPCSLGGVKGRPATDAQCGTFIVSENRDKPQGRLLALPVVKLPALSDTGLEPVFFLNGGPGATNIEFGLDVPSVFRNHDIYLVGYRGADDLKPLQCPEIAEAVSLPHPLSEAVRAEIGKAAKACATRFQAEGVDLSRYRMVDVVADIEELRAKLGIARINLIARSYGTRVAQYYTRLHPDSVRRVVLAAANPPGHFRWFPETTDGILKAYAVLCAKDAFCSGFTPDLAATMTSVLARPDFEAGGKSVDMDRIRIGAFMFMQNRTTALQMMQAAVLAEKGNTAQLARLSQLYLSVFPNAIIWGDMLSKGATDCANDAADFIPPRVPSATTLGSPFDLLLFDACASWPGEPPPAGFDKPARDETETLLISGNLDVATPLRYARDELLPHLPNGHLVELKEFGHGEWAREQQSALDRLLSHFLATGEVDASLYVYTPVVFAPQPPPAP